MTDEEIPIPKLNWELVESDSSHAPVMHRAEVPGGWLYCLGLGESIAFVPHQSELIIVNTGLKKSIEVDWCGACGQPHEFLRDCPEEIIHGGGY